LDKKVSRTMVRVLVLSRCGRHQVRPKLSDHPFDLRGQVMAGVVTVRDNAFRYRGTVFPGERRPVGKRVCAKLQTEVGQPAVRKTKEDHIVVLHPQGGGGLQGLLPALYTIFAV